MFTWLLRSTVLLAVATPRLTIGAGETTGGIFDDFRADPDFGDGAPLRWLPDGCCPGVFTPDENGLRFASTGQFPALLRTEQQFTGDVCVRALARGAPGIWVYAHVTAPDQVYIGGIRDNGNAVLNRLDETFNERLEQPLDFGPEAGVWVELRVAGTAVEVRVWPEGSERPSSPTLSRQDQAHRSGVVAIQARSAVFSSVRIDSGVVEPVEPTGPFRRGECNDDGEIDISDGVCILQWLFLGGPEPGCAAATDTNGDGDVDGADPVFLFNFLFAGGATPVSPYPACGLSELGADATLGCTASTEDC